MPETSRARQEPTKLAARRLEQPSFAAQPLVNRISLFDMVEKLGDRLTVGQETIGKTTCKFKYIRFPSLPGQSRNVPGTNGHIGKHFGWPLPLLAPGIPCDSRPALMAGLALR